MTYFADDPRETPTAARWPLWLSIAVVGGAFFVVNPDLTISRQETFAPWADSADVKASGGNAVKGLALATVGLLGLFFLVRREGRRLHFAGLLALVMLFYLSWAAASMAWSDDPTMTARRLAVLAFFFLGALGIARQFSHRDLAVMAMTVTAAHLAIGLSAELALGTFRPWSAGYRFAGTLHPNTQGAYLAILCLSAFVLARSSDSRGRRVWLALLVAVGLVFLLLTRSRTALAAFLLAASIVWLIRAPAARRLLAAAGAALAVFFVLLAWSLLGIDSGERLVEAAMLGRQEESELLTGRVPIWKELASHVRTHPLRGYGYESFWTVRHIEDVSSQRHWRLREAHSGYLDVVLSVGLIGAGALLLGAVLGMGRAASLYRETGHCEYGLTLGMLVYTMAASALESNVIGTSFISLVTLCGMARLAFVRPETTYPEHTEGPAPSKAGDWP